MPLLDLVTAWDAAVAGGDEAIARFQSRHGAILDRIGRRIAPDQPMLPLLARGPSLAMAVTMAHDPAVLDVLDQTERQGTSLGADLSHVTVLLALEGSGESMAVLPGEPALLVLVLTRLTDLLALQLAKLRGQALLTRWGASESASPLRAIPGTPWDYWELARSALLREWIYASGVATHLAAAAFPTLLPHQLLECKRGELARLRERERTLRDLLASELEYSGLGPLLRWLTPDTPAGLRTTPTQVIPPGAGAYLAWRMTADRVARVGVREALRLTA
jgi:hypothetical protein